MSAKRENAAILGAGVAACAVCCAGPILGVLTAIGLGTAAGVALLGAIALLAGALTITVVVVRRRRRDVAACTPAGAASPVPVELSGIRARR